MKRTAAMGLRGIAVLLGWSVLGGIPLWAQSPPTAPTLEVGIGFTNTPGWMGDGKSVVHATGWANAEYTSRNFGRFQVNGGSLTMDPSLNWDPWVDGIASVGFLVGYHNNASIGEGRNPIIPGSVAGLDGGVQVILSVLGAPLFVQARKSFAADQGSFLVLGSYLPIHPFQSLTVAFLPTARWLDKPQSELCFNAPALPDSHGSSAPYVAEAGFQDVALEVVLDFQISKSLHWVSSASQRWLMGSASRTPLTTSGTLRAFSSGFSIHM